MDKLCKVVDQSSPSVHATVAHGMGHAIKARTLPDVVLARNHSPVLPCLTFSGNELVLRSRVIDVLNKPAAANLRTLSTFWPSLSEMLAHGILPGAPETSFRALDAWWWLRRAFGPQPTYSFNYV